MHLKFCIFFFYNLEQADYIENFIHLNGLS